MLWTNLRESIGRGQGAVLGPDIPSRDDLSGQAGDVPDIMDERDADVVVVFEPSRQPGHQAQGLGRSHWPAACLAAEVRRDLPTAADARHVARILRQLYIETAVLTLWQWKEPLNETLRKVSRTSARPSGPGTTRSVPVG